MIHLTIEIAEIDPKDTITGIHYDEMGNSRDMTPHEYATAIECVRGKTAFSIRAESGGKFMRAMSAVDVAANRQRNLSAALEKVVSSFFANFDKPQPTPEPIP